MPCANRLPRWGIGILICAALWSPVTSSGGPAGEERERARQQFEQCRRLLQEARKLRTAGRLAEAADAAAQALKIERELLGPGHATLADTLSLLAELHEAREDFAAARTALRQAFDIHKKLHGEGHWETTDARLALADLERVAGMSRDQRRQLAEYRHLQDVGRRLFYQGLEAAAVAPTEQAIARCKALFGESHPQYALCLNNLVAAHTLRHDPAEAERLLRQALAIRRKTLGENHPDYAQSLRHLALVLESRASRHEAADDLKAARKAVEEILALRVKLHGEDNWRVADLRRRLEYLDLQARLPAADRTALREAAARTAELVRLWRARKFEQALPLALKVVEVRRKLLGERHPEYAASLFNLASQYDGLRRFDDAERVYHQALEIEKKTLGEDHPHSARVLNNLGVIAHKRGDDAKAIRLVGQALTILEEKVGREDEDYLRGRDSLLTLWEGVVSRHRERGEFAEAGKAQEELIQLLARFHGKRDLRVAEAQRDREALAEQAKRTPEERALLRKAAALAVEVARLWRAGKYKEALPQAEEVVAIRRKLLGESHLDYALGLYNLAAQYHGLRRFDKAEELYRRAWAIQEERLGAEHPDLAGTLTNLALLSKETGNYRRAEELLGRASAIRSGGEEGGSHSVEALLNLGHIAHERGDYARAEPLLREALERARKVLGANHSVFALALNNLGLLYDHMGDYAQAEPLLSQSCAIRRARRAEEPLMYALALNNLASLYNYMDEYELAEPLHREALAIRKEVLGETHPDYAMSLDNLGFMYAQKGDYLKAEPLYEQASAVYKQVLGKDHPDYAISLTHIAGIAMRKQDFVRAERLYNEAVTAFERTLGETHPMYYSGGLGALVRLHLRTGDAGRAAALARKRVELAEQHLEQTAAGQSERQQFLTSRQHRIALDEYLSVALPLRRPAEQVYAPVLAWKGSIFARQVLTREAQRIAEKSGDAGLRALFVQLDDVARRLAATALARPDPKKAQERLRELRDLTAEKEELEQRLAARSEAFGKLRGLVRLTPERLRAAVPPGVALIDIVRYGRHRPAPEAKGRLTADQHFVAFVIRADRPIEMVGLGSIWPVAAAVQSWRDRFGRPAKDDDPGATLRRLLWEKWEDRLDGIKTVLISPDSLLADIPFAALPGKAPGTFLLEERAIAVLPVPQLLPKVLAAGPGGAEGGPSLLLVGDVDYDLAPAAGEKGKVRPALRGTRDGFVTGFRHLPGTRGEIEALERSFRDRYPSARIEVLRGARATEAAFRRGAPQHRYLHLATHGFFAPPQLLSGLIRDRKDTAGRTAEDLFSRRGVGGINLGLMSGLALAGANQSAPVDAEDGILTALEVAALDLRDVEITVLSACETGLGARIEGEGLLGLQRAFQVAGARSVVATLWQVDDRATQVLMERFYSNLWRHRGPLGKLEALREAQLWMLREAPRQPGLVRGWIEHLRGERPELARGLEYLNRPTAGDRRLPPYFWAAFVLSGDWR